MTVDPTVHRSLGVEAFNSAWEILARPWDEISPEDADELTRRAYASAYHWSRALDHTIENDARAEWLLSRVWTVRGHGTLALAHAERCMDACTRGDLGDFDLAYAHEALARAHACLGDRDRAQAHRRAAAAVEIADPEDRDLVTSDLSGGPWFGL